MERRRGPDVLFVGHEATRTGAPLMLLYLLRWLRANTDLDIALLLLDGGPLVADYAETADVQVLSDLRETAWSRSLSRLRLGQLASSIRSVVARSWCRRYAATPLVYCNSVRSVRALGLLPKGDRTIVSHVHELELAISVATPAAERRLLLERPDWYIAASELVKQNLVDNHGIAPERIARHYEFIEVEPFLDSVPTATEIDALRDELAIPPGAAVVGAVGVAEPRKGPDLFLQLAMAFERRDVGRPVHFVWVGAVEGTEGTQWMAHDLDRSPLGPNVHVLGSVASPARYFAMFDVFALTSREDPFPLVCLESSLLGTPIVCFDNTGMAEFADDGDCGFVVPYLDVHAMADRIEALLRDPNARGAVGQRASAKVRDENDTAAVAPSIFADIARWGSLSRDG